MAFVSGARLGRYEIRSKLGAGGMGEVYLAFDTTLERQVAIKVLPADVAAKRERMSRFVQEARAASSLNHPNIITIYEIDESASGHFIAAEFIDGLTLRDVLRAGPMTLGEVLDVGVQVAGALAAAHAAGIVHRDIKPENVMRRRDGLVKLLDFGLAKLSEPPAGHPVADTPSAAPTQAPLATQPGIVLGTALYMSPEQARGRPVDARADIFSLGVVLYEMAAGRLPFEGSNTNEIVASLLSDREPPPLARSAPGAPPELERIVWKAMRKDRNERYQTAADLLLDLKSLKRTVEFHARASAADAPGSRALPTAGERARPAGVGAAWRTILPGVAALLAIAVSAYWLSIRRAGSATAIDSIAVMPFENRTNDKEVDYLSDGITESLIDSLSQLPGTRVIARSSVFTYKNRPIVPSEVRRRLDVVAVLTGRVMMQGDTLDVRAELTDARNDAQVWGDHYTRKATDLVAVPDDIARQVADALRIRLSGDQQEQLARHETEDAEAYRLYLQGRYFFNAGSEEDLNRAVSFFDRAIALDPRFALAYAARGEAYFTMGDLSLPMNAAMPKARENVLRALSLEGALPGALMLLANIKFQYDWKFAEADQDFRRVIAANPNDAEARHQYAYLLTMTRRPDEAVDELRRAEQLDPVNPSIVVDQVLPRFLSRQYDESIAAGRQALNLFPNFFLAHKAVGEALVQKGEVAAGIDELEKAKTLEPTPLVLGGLGYAYATAGRAADARKVLDELKTLSAKRYVAAYWSALICAGLNEPDQAFAWLEQGYRDRSFWMVWIGTDPRLDVLRPDARFGDLLRRIGFTD
jgi:TolB-like protein/Tfp pilus assembly protein PilF